MLNTIGFSAALRNASTNNYTNDGSAAGWVALGTAAIWAASPYSTALQFVRATSFFATWLCRKTVLDALITRVQTRSYACALVALGAQYAVAAIASSTKQETQGPPPPLPPLIFPCHTTHTRLFPSRHSFTYSYLLVGVPVGWRHASGSLSCDPVGGSKATWFSVHAEDYLSRGSHDGGLRGKLDDYLRSQGADPVEYLYAYLVTAPRFLGWSFNPVSFWYLYDSQRQLKAMILEVNNTFDERRMYFLAPSGQDEKFRERWQKDFHVSPFNEREGGYSLVAQDPFGFGKALLENARVTIDNTITLSSPDPHPKPKIVARVHSTAQAIDPSRLTWWSGLRFMGAWCWTGFLTNPRILREARTLWSRKNLQVFYRPEVNRGSIGRSETAEESRLEAGFSRWLNSLAMTENVNIEYIPAAGNRRGQSILIFASKAWDATSDVVLEVLSPEWYSELARCSDVRQIFERRCLRAEPGQGLAVIHDARSAQILVEALDSYMSKLPVANPPHRQTFTAAMVFNLRSGRGVIPAVVRSLLSAVRGSRNSKEQALFGDCLQRTLDWEKMNHYEHANLMVLLADRLTLGYTGLLRSYGAGLWFVSAYVIALVVTKRFR
jgi:DUF1365 family protein